MNTNTTRRGLLKAAPAAAIAVAVPSIATADMRPGIDRAEWDRALARFRPIEREHNELYRISEEADELAHAASPARVARYFDEYRLGIGMKRASVEYNLRLYQQTSGKQLDVAGTADEFDAYQQKVLNARKRFRTQEKWDAFRAHQPAFEAARDALMGVAAPDREALLTKIEIAAVSLDDEHAQSMLADARRIIGREE